MTYDFCKWGQKGPEINFTGRGHTYGHRNSMTESAQWADSVKILSNILKIEALILI